MRVIIAGGRDFMPLAYHWKWLDLLHQLKGITQVVCGMAPGADDFGRRWAIQNKIEVAEYPADWKQFGKSAGPRRNRQMAENADALVLFPGKRGTQNMFDEANAKGLMIFDWRTILPEDCP